MKGHNCLIKNTKLNWSYRSTKPVRTPKTHSIKNYTIEEKPRWMAEK